MKKTTIFTILFVVSVFAVSLFTNNRDANVFAAYEIPKYVGHVNDFENIIDNDAELEQKLAEYKASTTVEIAVLTTDNFGGDDIAPYANKVFRDWGIGDKEKNNGLLIIVSKAQRKSRIEVGYGLEYAITDSGSGKIQDTYMLPLFKEEKYSEGINNGVQAVLDVLDKKLDPADIASSQETESEEFGIGIIIQIVFFVIFMFGGVLAATKSWWLGGVLGGGIGLLIGSVLGGGDGAFLSTAGGIGIGLLLDYFLSKLPPGTKGSSPTGMSGWFWGGGRSSGFGGSSGGFGGFGGGSSGGGGSSRGW